MTDGEFGGFLTIEYRERETWAAELARDLKGSSERDFGGHVLTRDNTSFLDDDLRIVVD